MNYCIGTAIHTAGHKASHWTIVIVGNIEFAAGPAPIMNPDVVQ